MAHQLLILCPACSREDSITKHHCRSCGRTVHALPHAIVWNDGQQTVTEYYRDLQRRLSVSMPPPDVRRRCTTAGLPWSADMLRLSRPAQLLQGKTTVDVPGYRGLFRRRLPVPVVVDRGRLALLPRHLQFYGEHRTWTWAAGDITCITTDGHFFELKVRGQPLYQMEFAAESALKYEILLRKWLDDIYRQNGWKPIIEYQPRLRTVAPPPSRKLWKMAPPHPPLRQGFAEKVLTKLAALTVKVVLRLWISVEVSGREHWRGNGAGFVLVNHQSALDPFIVSAWLDHRIAFLTKSSAFVKRFKRWFLGWVMGLPTTRFQTDPAIVRIMQAMLQQGIKVGVFPEGERCWDGQLAPFKLSLVKILLASRMPIYPVILDNVFGFWPRWLRTPRRANIQIRVHPPFCLLPGVATVDEQRRFLEGVFRQTCPTPSAATAPRAGREGRQ